MLPCCVDGMCEYDLLDDIRNKPYEVFLNDLMFLLCQECKVSWVPPCYGVYKIHPMSPLSADIWNFTRPFFRRMYAILEVVWYKSCEECKDSESQMILLYDKELKIKQKNIFNYLIQKLPIKLFEETISTAATCILFYEYGMEDAPSTGVTGMTEVFHEYFQKTGYRFHAYSNCISLSLASKQIVNLLPKIIKDPHNVFTRDLLFHMCSEYNVKWCPPNSENYEISFNSPFTSDMKKYINKAPLVPEATYFTLLKYFRNRQSSVFVAISQGLTRILEDISTAIIPQVKSTEDVLGLVLHVACLSVHLHRRGMYGFLCAINRKMSEALRKCNIKNKGRLFDLFGAYTWWHNNQNENYSSSILIDLNYFLQYKIVSP